MLRDWPGRWKAIATEFAEEFKGIGAFALFMVPLGGGLLWLEWYNQDRGAFSAAAFYFLTIVGMFVFPVAAAVRHQWRQARAMDKIRSAFAQALETLNAGNTKRAERYLLTIKRWERHWRFGNGWLFRSAYCAIVLAITATFGVLHYLFYYTMYETNGLSRKKAISLLEAVIELTDKPILLGVILVVGSLYGLGALNSLKHIQESSWRDFYSRRLEAVLKAGRAVGAAKPLEEIAEVSPRELFGLDENYTKAQLRRAWLRLAKELHPDRFASADVQTRAAKEAALKRVNAYRDYLDRFARG